MKRKAEEAEVWEDQNRPLKKRRKDALKQGVKRKVGCIGVYTGNFKRNNIGNDYVIGNTIGRGQFGCVQLCTSTSKRRRFACKTLTKEGATVHQEVEIMQHLSGHPGVVTLEAVYEETEGFHLVMELCSGGRLMDQMRKRNAPYSEQGAASLIKDLMVVINYCHDLGVVHRDIKPQNILLTASGKIKLADFGIATRFSKAHDVSGMVGTAHFLAPEVSSGSYSEKVDIWSAGVILHALLLGHFPFRGRSLPQILDQVMNKRLDFHTGEWENISKSARDLMGKMLTRDVSARMTAAQVLRHPWILFHTERGLKTRSEMKKQVRTFSGPIPDLLDDNKKIDNGPGSHASEEQDGYECDVSEDQCRQPKRRCKGAQTVLLDANKKMDNGSPGGVVVSSKSQKRGWVQVLSEAISIVNISCTQHANTFLEINIV